MGLHFHQYCGGIGARLAHTLRLAAPQCLQLNDAFRSSSIQPLFVPQAESGACVEAFVQNDRLNSFFRGTQILWVDLWTRSSTRSNDFLSGIGANSLVELVPALRLWVRFIPMKKAAFVGASVETSPIPPTPLNEG